jgi:hypothetical protein
MVIGFSLMASLYISERALAPTTAYRLRFTA